MITRICMYNPNTKVITELPLDTIIGYEGYQLVDGSSYAEIQRVNDSVVEQYRAHGDVGENKLLDPQTIEALLK